MKKIFYKFFNIKRTAQNAILVAPLKKAVTKQDVVTLCSILSFDVWQILPLPYGFRCICAGVCVCEFGGVNVHYTYTEIISMKWIKHTFVLLIILQYSYQNPRTVDTVCIVKQFGIGLGVWNIGIRNGKGNEYYWNCF